MSAYEQLGVETIKECIREWAELVEDAIAAIIMYVTTGRSCAAMEINGALTGTVKSWRVPSAVTSGVKTASLGIAGVLTEAKELTGALNLRASKG